MSGRVQHDGGLETEARLETARAPEATVTDADAARAIVSGSEADGRTRVLGHAIITDPVALERRAEELSDQSFRFREWIKFHCDLESDELDVVVRETTDEVWRHIDCQACGRCCRLDVVTVDDNDVARLARRLDITPAEFTQRHVKMVMGEQSMVTGPCPFLKGNSCSVYEDRPTACSDFPFLHSPGFRHRMLVLIDFSSLCPVVLNTIEVLKLKLGWKRGRGRKP